MPRHTLTLLALIALAAPAAAQGRRADSAPDAGELAPEVSLHPLGEHGKPDTSKTIKLSELTAERPVALVFGSYT